MNATNNTLKRYSVMLLATGSLLSGCASIINTGNQKLSVLTTDPQHDYQTTCRLSNDEGVVTTRPGVVVTVGRDSDAMRVECASNVASGSIVTEPHATAWWLGNILMFGIFSPPFILIDGANSADWNYDNTIVVPMRGNAQVVTTR